MTDVTTLADYFLICTGTSNTHVNTLCDEVEKVMTEAGETLLHREGHRQRHLGAAGLWLPGCPQVFTDDTRKFYDLERLWSDAVEEPLTCGE